MGLYLVIMGVQGAGKGTQAAFVKDKYNIPHISTGDLFRAMRAREDELARRVQEIMNAGQLISDEITNEVLRDRLQQPDAANGVILDGYPRNPAQAEWLENYLQERGEKLTAVLLLDLDYYTAFKRAFGRVKSEQTGETYNIYFNDEVEAKFVDHAEKAFPPRLEATHTPTGEVLQRRPDDEAFSVVKRIDIYRETTMPLIDHYRQKGLLVTIDADQPIEKVSQDITTAIEQK
ncbi:MAG: adenylate kinase [Anaerolineae bacterium]